MKDSDAATRVAAANGFCALAKKNGAASAPYLRIAARDDHDDVRTAAAACLADVAAADAKGASRIAAELAESPQPTVRWPRPTRWPRSAPEAAALSSPTLLKLIADSDPQVRSSAERAFAKGVSKLDGKRYADAERALEAALVQGDVAERKLIVSAATKAGLGRLLRQAARDGDEGVRLEAVRAAGAGKGIGAGDRARRRRRSLADGARGGDAPPGRGRGRRGARDVLPTFEAMLHGPDGRRGSRRWRASASCRTRARRASACWARRSPSAARRCARRRRVRSAGWRSASPRRSRPPSNARARRLLRRAQRGDPGLALPGRRAWTRASWAASWSGRTPTASGAWSPSRRWSIAQRQTTPAQDRAAARGELDRIADTGPALARLAARIGKSFIDAPPAESTPSSNACSAARTPVWWVDPVSRRSCRRRGWRTACRRCRRSRGRGRSGPRRTA